MFPMRGETKRVLDPPTPEGHVQRRPTVKPTNQTRVVNGYSGPKGRLEGDSSACGPILAMVVLPDRALGW